MVAASKPVAQQIGKNDVFISHILRINQFIQEGLAFQKTNSDYDNALSQMEVYSLLNDLSRELVRGSCSQGALSLLEEIVEIVDKASSTGLSLRNHIHSKYMEWCQSKSSQEETESGLGPGSAVDIVVQQEPAIDSTEPSSCQSTPNSGSTAVLGKSPRKRSPSPDDSEPIKKQSMAISEVEDSIDNVDKEVPAAEGAESSSSQSKLGTSPRLVIEFTEKENKRLVQLVCGAASQVIVKKFNIEVFRSDIRTLFGSNWLNDNVINFYMELLNERSQLHVGQLPSVYAMNSYFLARLMSNGYSAVQRWTRKVDLFSKDLIPVPVHYNGHPSHWSMAIIDMRDKTIRFYDSMGYSNTPVLVALAAYLEQESMAKRSVQLEASCFKIENVQEVPRQYNGNDCGVFCCKFAEYLTRDAPLTFNQGHMVAFRKKMMLEIADGKLRT